MLNPGSSKLHPGGTCFEIPREEALSITLKHSNPGNYVEEIVDSHWASESGERILRHTDSQMLLPDDPAQSV